MTGNVVCKDGVFVYVEDGTFVCSDRTTYRLSGYSLVGPEGVVSRYCSDEQMALDMIVSKHGGLK